MKENIRQRMQESLYQTADAGDTLSDRGCSRFYYQTADAGDSLSDSYAGVSPSDS